MPGEGSNTNILSTEFNKKELYNKGGDDNHPEESIIKEASENVNLTLFKFSCVEFIKYLHKNE